MQNFDWRVVRTSPRAEFLAATELERDGLEVYCPRVLDPLVRSHRPDTALFPGYLFLRCNDDDGGLPSFRPNHRVFGWLRLGGLIPTVPDSVITDLKDQVESLNEGGGIWRRYQVGEKVTVRSNNIETLAQVLEEPRSPKARVKVLMQFMGRAVKAQVPWESLSPVDQHAQIRRGAPRRTRGRGRFINYSRGAAAAQN